VAAEIAVVAATDASASRRDKSNMDESSPVGEQLPCSTTVRQSLIDERLNG
jgi:hypothetical protein